jgi:YD repeat-containing protein
VYTWDAANRLVSANVDGLVNSFEYDGSGNRVAQTVGEVTIEYVLDVGGGLPEVIVATTGGARALEPLNPLSGTECGEGRSGQRHQPSCGRRSGRGDTRCRTTCLHLWRQPGACPVPGRCTGTHRWVRSAQRRSPITLTSSV